MFAPSRILKNIWLTKKKVLMGFPDLVQFLLEPFYLKAVDNQLLPMKYNEFHAQKAVAVFNLYLPLNKNLLPRTKRFKRHNEGYGVNTVADTELELNTSVELDIFRV